MNTLRFPQDRIGFPRIAGMRCAECGSADIQIIHVPAAGLVPFCSPLCAAGYGLEPWASADLLTRIAWHEDAQRRERERA